MQKTLFYPKKNPDLLPKTPLSNKTKTPLQQNQNATSTIMKRRFKTLETPL